LPQAQFQFYAVCERDERPHFHTHSPLAIFYLYHIARRNT